MQRRFVVVLVAVAACGHGSSPSSPIAATTTSPPPPAIAATLAIVDATVVPMDSDRELPHQTVLIDRDAIVAVGPVATTPVPAGAQRVEGAGKWLVAGV